MQFYDLYNQYKVRFPYIHAYLQVKSSWPALYHLLLFQFCSVWTKPLSVADVSELTAIIYIPLLSNATEFLHFNDKLTAKPFFLFKILLLLLRIKSIKRLSFSHRENQILFVQGKKQLIVGYAMQLHSVLLTEYDLSWFGENWYFFSIQTCMEICMIAELANGISIRSKKLDLSTVKPCRLYINLWTPSRLVLILAIKNMMG